MCTMPSTIRSLASSKSSFFAMSPRKTPMKPQTPKQVKPWDAPFARTGDTNEDDLYNAIGRALTDWEFVEKALARIFAAFTGTVAYPSAGPSVRAYGALRLRLGSWRHGF
jgi:hypothetical protein